MTTRACASDLEPMGIYSSNLGPGIGYNTDVCQTQKHWYFCYKMLTKQRSAYEYTGARHVSLWTSRHIVAPNRSVALQHAGLHLASLSCPLLPPADDEATYEAKKPKCSTIYALSNANIQRQTTKSPTHPSTRWKWVFSVTLRPLYSLWKRHCIDWTGSWVRPNGSLVWKTSLQTATLLSYPAHINKMKISTRTRHEAQWCVYFNDVQPQISEALSVIFTWFSVIFKTCFSEKVRVRVVNSFPHNSLRIHSCLLSRWLKVPVHLF